LVNVGDVVMMTSALDLIRQKFPRVRLAALIRPDARDLMEGNPLVDEVIVYPYRSGSLFRGLGELRSRIAAGNYELYFSLDRRPRAAAAAFISGIGRRVGPDLLFAGARPEFWTRLLFNQVVSLSPEECRGSLVEMFQLPVRRAFQIEGRGRITLPPVKAERAGRVKAWLPAGDGPLIGLCVKTNDPGKTWPAAGFSLLIRRLQADLKARLYLTGGPGDRDYVEALLKEAGAEAAVNLAGLTELMDLPALAAASDLFITLDNAAAHLAANSGLKNIICLLLATTPAILLDSMPQAVFRPLSPIGPPAGQAVLAREADGIFRAAREILGK
jgi:ADP-heptose:LPS heptosyltransferase